MPNEDLNEQLKLHQSLRLQLPNCFNAFFAKFGKLKQVQIESIPLLLSGKSVLISAPTAGGKTEAVIAPFCERMTRNRANETSVIVVTPTRALVNDLYRRLEKSFDELGLTLARKTGDHSLAKKTPPRMIITTPESLESMLTFAKIALSNVWGLIVDEIHLLDGSPRGDQLRIIIQRLKRFLSTQQPGKTLQIAAMSATVPDPFRLAKAYLGESAEVLKVPGQRRIESEVVPVSGTDIQTTLSCVGAMRDIDKILVFAKKRKDVDHLSVKFKTGIFERVPVYGHHGSLSKAERERTEERFRVEKRAVCVATMTLEVGIDIGDIDLVVCLCPPSSLSSFLQRIGRGSRRNSGCTKVLCIAQSRAEEIIYNALIRQASICIPTGPTPPFRRSVLVQQILAYLRQVDKHTRSRQQIVDTLTTLCQPQISEHFVNEVCRDMLTQELVVERGGIMEPATSGWDFIKSDRIFSNIAPEPAGIELVDADTGQLIANILDSSHKEKVSVAGRNYAVTRSGSGKVMKARLSSENAPSPEYFTKSVSMSPDIGTCVMGYLNVPASNVHVIQLDRQVVIFTWLGKLINQALAATCKKRGIKATAYNFSVCIQNYAIADVKCFLADVVRETLEVNPLGTIPVEKYANLGPHISLISQGELSRARTDWLDATYITDWINSVISVVVVDTESQLGSDLVSLVKV